MNSIRYSILYHLLFVICLLLLFSMCSNHYHRTSKSEKIRYYKHIYLDSKSLSPNKYS